jgi:LuxR family quorum sensing-dependent transcriptional regulator
MLDTRNLTDHALDYCESLMHFADPVEVAEAFQRVASHFGVEHFVVTDIPVGDQRFERAVLLRRLPPGWFECYARKDFVRVDPVIRLCRSTTAIFDWTEAPYDREREPRSHEVMTSAVEFGLVRGLSLPIHGLDGLETCFSVSGKAPEFNGRTRPALHLMMMYTYERIRQIIQRASVAENPLTPREREVLCWAANGKSAAETGDIMAITERTVNAHASSAMAKLDACSRTQAVVRAMQRRYIHL